MCKLLKVEHHKSTDKRLDRGKPPKTPRIPLVGQPFNRCFPVSANFATSDFEGIEGCAVKCTHMNEIAVEFCLQSLHCYTNESVSTKETFPHLTTHASDTIVHSIKAKVCRLTFPEIRFAEKFAQRIVL